jgi:hypothetical protein
MTTHREPVASDGYYVAIASSSANSSHPAYAAFDKVTTTFWSSGRIPGYYNADGSYTSQSLQTATLVDGTVVFGDYLQICLPFSQIVVAFMLAVPANVSRAWPYTIALVCSLPNVSSNWATVHTETGIKCNVATGSVTFNVTGMLRLYECYRCIVARNRGDAATAISELMLMTDFNYKIPSPSSSPSPSTSFSSSRSVTPSIGSSPTASGSPTGTVTRSKTSTGTASMSTSSGASTVSSSEWLSGSSVGLIVGGIVALLATVVTVFYIHRRYPRLTFLRNQTSVPQSGNSSNLTVQNDKRNATAV